MSEFSNKITKMQERIKELESAIRNHRDQHGDDRCWMDDLELYKVLGDGVIPDNTVGNKEEMLENCKRYIDIRCSQGSWKTYKELEEENTKYKETLMEILKCDYLGDAIWE